MNNIVAGYANLGRLLDAVTEAWPQHTDFLKQRFGTAADPAMPLCEKLAGLVLKLSGDELPVYCRDYRWMCENFVAEDLFFRRHGRYRVGSSAEAEKEVYSRADYMPRYLRGILLSQVLWKNQTDAFQFYVDSFLSRMEQGSRFLEIGPGHGLLVYFAGANPNIASISGWDISDSSIAMTRAALEAFGFDRSFNLRKRDILRPTEETETFDAVVLSEVLEHLDEPELAVGNVAQVVRPGGQIFFNVPINSPAPDHVYNGQTVEAVVDLISRQGLRIVDTAAVPMTGYDLERAMKRKVTVNVLVVAERSKDMK